jgi:hypothetical protein
VRWKTLIQVVDHRKANLRYPIVADPTYRTYTFDYSRADVEAMWNGLEKRLLK